MEKLTNRLVVTFKGEINSYEMKTRETLWRQTECSGFRLSLLFLRLKLLKILPYLLKIRLRAHNVTEVFEKRQVC